MDKTTESQIISRAGKILVNCKETAFDGKTPIYTTFDRKSANVPKIASGKGCYDGVYWRDFYYTVTGFGEAFPQDDLDMSMRYLLEPEVGKMQIPGYHQTDEIVFHKSRFSDGTPFCNYKFPWQTPYSADNPMFAIMLTAEYIRRGGDIGLFAENAEKLELAISSVHLSERHLVHHTGPYIYGFYDCINLAGEQTYASVLYLNAARDFSELYGALGNEEKATKWRETAGKIQENLPALLTEDGDMFISDTGVNFVTDIWASAYAVYSDAVDTEIATRISRWMVEHYEQFIRDGHVRHVPKPDNWKCVVGGDSTGVGFMQNGAYWSVASPWVLYTLALTDKALADQMVEDLAATVLEYDFAECINEDKTCRLPGYTASAGMALLALRIAEGQGIFGIIERN